MLPNEQQPFRSGPVLLERLIGQSPQHNMRPRQSNFARVHGGHRGVATRRRRPYSHQFILATRRSVGNCNRTLWNKSTRVQISALGRYQKTACCTCARIRRTSYPKQTRSAAYRYRRVCRNCCERCHESAHSYFLRLQGKPTGIYCGNASVSPAVRGWTRPSGVCTVLGVRSARRCFVPG